MLPDQIVRNRVQVQLGVADRVGVADSQHSQVDLLGQIGGMRLGPDATVTKRLERRTVLGEQSLDERFRAVAHGHCRVVGRRLIVIKSPALPARVPVLAPPPFMPFSYWQLR